MLYRTTLLAFAAAAVGLAPSSLRAAPTSSSPNASPPSADAVPIALLVDLSTGQTLFARNAQRRFAPASITKVMTAYTTFELIDAGKLSPVQRIGYRRESFNEWWRKGSTMFLPVDAMPTVEELLTAVTTVSANDGAVVLAEGVAGSVENWTMLMNANARRLGMRDSHFGTPNGWPDEGRTFVSARDLVTLGTAIVQRHPTLFKLYIGRSGMQTGEFRQVNHDPITGQVAGADGIKTGFTNQAGFGFLGTAKRNGRRLMMVVANVDSGRERNRAARAFMEWGFQHFNNAQLFSARTPIAEARVQDGTQDFIPLATGDPVRISFPRDSRPNITTSIQYEGPLRAPVEKGERIAWLTVQVPGMQPVRAPLFAGEQVRAASPIRRAFNAVRAFWQ